MFSRYMKDNHKDKRKVTFYVPPDLHRKLKVRSALDSEPMSAIAERAIRYYLSHPDAVDGMGEVAHGQSYQLHSCPECDTSLIVKEGELQSVESALGVLPDPPTLSSAVVESTYTEGSSDYIDKGGMDKGSLVTC